MSMLAEKTQALVDAVQVYEQAAAALQELRNAIDAAHKDLADLLSSTPQPVQQ